MKIEIAVDSAHVQSRKHAGQSQYRIAINAESNGQEITRELRRDLLVCVSIETDWFFDVETAWAALENMSPQIEAAARQIVKGHGKAAE